MCLTSSTLQKHFGECGFYVETKDDRFFLTKNLLTFNMMHHSASPKGCYYLADFVIFLVPNGIKVAKNRISNYMPLINLGDPEFFTKLDAVFGIENVKL